MNRRQTLGAALAAVTLIAGVLTATGSARAEMASGSPSSAAATPVVVGNRIVDSRTGTPFVPHAVNWPSFEYACQQGWADSGAGATPAAAAAMASWGINAVRLPLNQDCWLGVDGAPAYGTVGSYQAAISSWVTALNNAGLAVILDLHWTAPTGFAADGQRAMPDAQSVTFWSQVASAYKSSPSVLFETFNEPYSRGSYTVSWSCWKSGGCQVPSSNDQSDLGTSTYTAVGQAQIVAAIRATGAAQPILLDGLNYANDLTGWLANKPTDSQLIASWHNYPGQGCSSTSCWASQVLPVAASVPVITTEFGETDGGSSYLSNFMSWADAQGIGYAPWAWWVTSPSDGADANLYSLISDLSSFAPRAPEGTAYHDHLAGLSRPLPPGNPIGSFDAATVTGLGSAAVSGWAIDPDTTASITTHFYVDGAFATATTASVARPDVGAAYPAYGANHGWTVTLTLAGGAHTICAYAINTGSGSTNPQLGCRTVTIPTGNPYGSFDVATISAVGQVTLGGWSIDPDTSASIATHIYVDGVFADGLSASANRPDVAAAFPLYGAAHGWNAIIPLAGGAHTICAYAINAGPGSVNTQLGCRVVTIPSGNPFGSFDVAATTGPGQVTVAGWSIDPDTAASIPTHLYVDGAFATGITASTRRPDVAAVYPLYGAPHGWNVTLPLSAGAHTICAYAINVGPGSGNPQLGCRVVTVTAAA